MADDRVRTDLHRYVRRSRSGPCFVCAMLAGDPDYAHEIVYDDGTFVAFLNRYPTLYGYVLVAPREHLEHAVRDFDEAGYLKLQSVLYRVARAVESVVGGERTYLLSLGSQQGNSHLHWHVAPLPPGVPYERQQFHALMMSEGVIPWSPRRAAELAGRLRRALSAPEDENSGRAL
jgi:diadenosine tetraphosphate (Ap4A) HIT family hydrolase